MTVQLDVALGYPLATCASWMVALRLLQSHDCQRAVARSRKNEEVPTIASLIYASPHVGEWKIYACPC